MTSTQERDRKKRSGARKATRGGSEKASEPFLDKSRTITGPRLAALSATLLEAYRGIADKGRQRRRREEDATAVRAIIDTILANLIHQYLATGRRRNPIVVPMKKFVPPQTRYDQKGFRKLQDIVTELHDAGEIGFQSGSKGKASTIWASDSLARRIAALKPTYGDLGRKQTETIILSCNEWTFVDGLKADGSTGPVRSKRNSRVDYADTDGPSGTIAARRRLGALSEWLSAADLQFSKPGHRIDTTSVILTRRFTLTEGQTERGFKFDQNGRLQDGWWMQVSSEDRQFIRIGGEPIADLDYSAMFIRLGCIKAGITLAREVDPYRLRGWDRDGVKIAMLAMIFADSPRARVPPKAAEKLPPGTTMTSIREAIAAHRPEIMPIFERGWGLELMHRESEVMMALLEALKKKGIIALPMHDGVMVQRSQAAETQQVMSDVSRQMLGSTLPVKRKPVKGLD
jgi:hypothetical protein